MAKYNVAGWAGEIACSTLAPGDDAEVFDPEVARVAPHLGYQLLGRSDGITGGTIQIEMPAGKPAAG